MIKEVHMKQKRVPVWILLACTFVSALSITASTVLGSEIESHAQISFQMPEYIPVEQ